MADDIQAVTRLVYAYCELLDLGDIEGLKQLFAHTVVRTRDERQGVSGTEFIENRIGKGLHLYDGVPSTKHVVSNLVVDVDEDRNSASARSYFVAFQWRPEFPLQAILAGRWRDRFERDGSTWRFAERDILTDLFGDTRFHIKVASG